ncbi:MAG: lipid II flippase MurJ, partial [Anaerolineales bacterium]
GAGLVGHCIVEILARAFYAMHDTRTPVLVGTIAMGFNVILSFLFSRWFLNLGWMPHGGLALANSVATALEMIGLITLMRYKIGGLEGRSLFTAIIQATVASIGMLVVLLWWMGITSHRHAALVTFGGIVFGAAVYLGLGWLFGNREIRSGIILVRQKWVAR